MKKLPILLLALLLLCCVQEKSEERGFEVTDMAGNKVVLKETPKRAVFLAGESWVYALGIKENVVAVSDLAKRNPIILKIDAEVAKIPSVGDMAKANEEAILSLNPDVIIIWDEPPGYKETAKRLEKLGIPLIRLGYIDSYPDDVCMEAKLLGKIFGKEQRAEELCEFFVMKWREVVSKKQEKDVRVLYSFTSPTYIACNVSTQPYVIFIKAVGGEVISPACNATWVQVSKEWILQANPEVWIISYYAPYNESAVINDPAFYNLDAVKNGRVYKESYKPLQFLEPYFLLTVYEYASWINPGSFDVAKEEEELLREVYGR